MTGGGVHRGATPGGSAADPVIEEPWEVEIGSLLGRLPPVEPPAGFIDSAIDHRPLHAGRILVALGAVTALVVLGTLLTGAVGRAEVVPPLEELMARHDRAAQAGLVAELGGRGERGTTADPTGPLDLPDGFRPAGAVAAEEIRQAVYARGDESVSVFVQDGQVAWSVLDADGLTELAGLPAWVDVGREIAVIEVDGQIVTIIGLDPAELELTIGGRADADPSLGARAWELAEAIVVQLGYAPAG